MIRPLPCFRVALLLLPLLGLACEVVVKGKGKTTGDARPQTIAAGEPYSDPPNWDSRPSFKAAISDIVVNWPDNQQTFTLTLTNTGDRLEKVHAIVYASNESIDPPRRALYPMTASATAEKSFGWFAAAGSRDGRLSPLDVERHWEDDFFVTARGGKLKVSEVVTVKPLTSSKPIPAAHDLYKNSPYPAHNHKALATAGFTEYKVWLFTDDGRWFAEQVLPATPNTVKKNPK